MPYVPKSLGEEADVSGGDQSLTYYTKTLVIFAVILVLGVVLISRLAEVTAGYIPDQWEVRVFSPSAEEPKKDSDEEQKDGVFGDAVVGCQQFPSYAGFEKSLGFKRLLEQAKRQLNFKIHCLDESTPNAFAYPGGGVYLTSELLKHVKSPVGLAFVIGHELGHHENRHVLRRLGRMISFQGVFAMFGMADIQGVEVFSQLGELSFSRGDELEADDFGVKVVSTYFKEYQGVTEFFDYVATLDESKISDSKIGNIFSTHPVNSERIQRIQQRLGLHP